jgi:hypothetical protein
MMLAVTAALIVQLFLVRPSLADVVTWGEFKRSGWSNPRAFAIAIRWIPGLRTCSSRLWSRRSQAA